MSDHIQIDLDYFQPETCDLNEFMVLIDQRVDPSTVPAAKDIQKNIPIYDASGFGAILNDGDARRALMAEWARVLRSGPGVLVLAGAYRDTAVLDDATLIYEKIIKAEKLASRGGGDHFAASGANDRIWNSLQKLGEAAPDVFLKYFANPPIAAVCEAWLGPNYQMTAQINLVHPGGAAQQAHRDYHLGFQTAAICADYPAHVHTLSPALTLQGAIAHCDMPLESGPTKLLPFSQCYPAGYAAWRRDDFRSVFEDRYIQLPLIKGDALFFNPALFHAAGANTSSHIHRMANLLQVSSAFGRAMETIDRRKLCKLVYPYAADALDTGRLDALAVSASIAATAEGYSFPTNLDRDPPKDGLAPETQQAYFARALAEGTSHDDFARHLDEIHENQRA